MKSLLIETKPFNVSPMALTEGKSMNGNPLVEGVLATPEVKNGNGRYYSKDLWQREINKYMDLVKERRACGELDQQDSQVINLKNVSHNINKIWWDGENIMGAIGRIGATGYGASRLGGAGQGAADGASQGGGFADFMNAAQAYRYPRRPSPWG